MQPVFAGGDYRYGPLDRATVDVTEGRGRNDGAGRIVKLERVGRSDHHVAIEAERNPIDVAPRNGDGGLRGTSGEREAERSPFRIADAGRVQVIKVGGAPGRTFQVNSRDRRRRVDVVRQADQRSLVAAARFGVADDHD